MEFKVGQMPEESLEMEVETGLSSEGADFPVSGDRPEVRPDTQVSTETSRRRISLAARGAPTGAEPEQSLPIHLTRLVDSKMVALLFAQFQPLQVTQSTAFFKAIGETQITNLSHNALEQEYRKIGWLDGPYGTREAHQQIRRFWINTGVLGASWLVRRLRRETHCDVLDASSSLLADIGSFALYPILTELNHRPSQEQAKALLCALRWIPAAGNPPFLDRLESTINRFLLNADPELREVASAATTPLPRDRALELLRHAIQVERDNEIREALTEAIAERLRE